MRRYFYVYKNDHYCAMKVSKSVFEDAAKYCKLQNKLDIPCYWNYHKYLINLKDIENCTIYFWDHNYIPMGFIIKR